MLQVAQQPNSALHALHSRVTPLAEGRKRLAAGRTRERER